MQQVGPDQRQVLDPDEHVQVDGALGLEFEAVDVGQQIGLAGLLLGAEEVLLPAVGVGSGQVASGYLLKHVSHVEHLQQREVCWLQAVLLSDLLEEAGPRKCSLVRTYGDKERGKSVLANRIQQVQVLPLPVGS